MKKTREKVIFFVTREQFRPGQNQNEVCILVFSHIAEELSIHSPSVVMDRFNNGEASTMRERHSSFVKKIESLHTGGFEDNIVSLSWYSRLNFFISYFFSSCVVNGMLSKLRIQWFDVQ